MSARRLAAGLGAVVFVACAAFEEAEPSVDAGGIDAGALADAPADTRRFCERFVPFRFGQPEAGAEQCIVIFGSDDASGRFLEQVGGAAFEHPLLRFPRDSRWSHVEVLVDRAAATVDVLVDGARAVSEAQVLQPTCLGPDSQLEIMPGLHCEATSDAPHEIRLDNLVVTGTR